MNTEKTFVFNGVTYDTERFLKGQKLFMMITPEENYVLNPARPPFISSDIETPIVLQYEGALTVMACSEDVIKEISEGKFQKKVRLITKHTLKSYTHREHVEEELVEDLQRQWQPPRRGGFQQRPYQSRGGYSNRRY